jgi:hypothetical protein
MTRRNIFILFCVSFLEAVIGSGCTSTYHVTDNVSEIRHKKITKEEFFEEVAGKKISITLHTGQLRNGKILSLHNEQISFAEGIDTVTILLKDINIVTDKHYVTGALVGVPLGFLVGGLVGGYVGQGMSDHDDFWGGLVGFTCGIAIGPIVGVTVGVVSPPTTIYEFSASTEINKKQFVP